MVATTGLRELRQQPSDLVRQAEAGETIIVTVNGRAVTQLRPVRRRQWRRAADLAGIFSGGADDDWSDERDLIEHTVEDPFIP